MTFTWALVFVPIVFTLTMISIEKLMNPKRWRLRARAYRWDWLKRVGAAAHRKFIKPPKNAGHPYRISLFDAWPVLKHRRAELASCCHEVRLATVDASAPTMAHGSAARL